MNKLYDVVIIGKNNDSDYLLNRFDILCANKPLKASCAIISRNAVERHSAKNLDLDYYINEVVFIKYNRGMIIVYFKDNSIVCTKKLILALGGKQRMVNVVADNLYYSYDENIDLVNKNVVIFGDHLPSKQTLTAISSKAVKVFLCQQSMFTAKASKKNSNIVYLQNTFISNFILNKHNIKQVELSTYNKIDCDVVFAFLGRIPDVEDNFNTILTKDSSNRINIDANGRVDSGLNIFAIGECAANASKDIIDTVAVELCK